MPSARSRWGLRFFSVGRDRIEPDVGDEDPGRPQSDAAILLVLVQERPPVGWIDVRDSHADDGEHHADVDQHHRGIEPRALLDADDQDDGDGHRDQNGGQVEPGQGLGAILQGHELEDEFLLLEVVVPGRRKQPGVQVDIEHMLEHGIEVARPAVGNEA